MARGPLSPKAVVAAAVLHGAGLAALIWIGEPSPPRAADAPLAVRVTLVSTAPNAAPTRPTPAPFADLTATPEPTGGQRSATPPRQSLEELLGKDAAAEAGGDADPLGRLYMSRTDNSPADLRAQILRCWKLGTGKPVQVQFILDARGRLLQPPSILRETFADPQPDRESAAMEAVRTCAPYRSSREQRSYIMEFR